jgi:chaperonin GroEL
MRGVFNILAVNPPGYQEQRLAVLQDIAAFTGATVITNASTTFHHSHTGTASHVTANKTTTTIVEGAGNKKLVEARIAELREKLGAGDITLYEREKYEERLSKLSAGVSLIKVGARSETVKREKFEKTKDAIGASKAALAEGVVVGGGMAFLALAKLLEIRGQTLGQRVLYSALQEPARKLLINAGKNKLEQEAIMARLMDRKLGKREGYNVNTDAIEDLTAAGVLDPARVIRLSLENAVVVASSMLTAEGVIVEAPQKQQQQG